MYILTTVMVMPTAATPRDPSTALVLMGILVMESPVWVRIYGIYINWRNSKILPATKIARIFLACLLRELLIQCLRVQDAFWLEFVVVHILTQEIKQWLKFIRWWFKSHILRGPTRAKCDQYSINLVWYEGHILLLGKNIVPGVLFYFRFVTMTEKNLLLCSVG